MGPTPASPFFTRVALEEAEQGSPVDEALVDSSGASARAVRPAGSRKTWTKRAILSALSVTALAFVVMVMVRRPDSETKPPKSEVYDRLEESFIKKFRQCGGSDWAGSTCCQKGCACVIKTKFYSMCKTPTGSLTCDKDLAEKEVLHIRNKAKTMGDRAKLAGKEATKAAKEAIVARAAYNKAHKPLPPLIAKGKEKKEIKDKAEKVLKKASEEAEKAAKAAKEADISHEGLTSKVAQFDRDAKLGPGGKCGAMYKTCGGSVAADAACCNDGCVCHWKDNFYAQCRPPHGAFSCNADAKAKEETASRKLLKELETKKNTTAKKKEETAKVEAEALEKAKVARKDAAEAGAKRVHAQRIANKRAHVKKQAVEKASKAKEAAVHAKHAIKYVAAEVGVWRRVAKGNSCSDLDAAEISAMDLADIRTQARKTHLSKPSFDEDDDGLGDLGDLDDLDDLDLGTDEDEPADDSEEKAADDDDDDKEEEVRVLD